MKFKAQPRRRHCRGKNRRAGHAAPRWNNTELQKTESHLHNPVDSPEAETTYMTKAFSINRLQPPNTTTYC